MQQIHDGLDFASFTCPFPCPFPRGSNGQVCARVPKQGNINDLLEADDWESRRPDGSYNISMAYVREYPHKIWP